MRAMLIDPFTRTISEADYNGDFKQIYKFIGADCFDVVVHRVGDIYVDDEGLFKPNAFFEIQGYPQPLAGKGLVLGVEVNDKVTNNTFPLSVLKQLVTFTTQSLG